MSAALRFKQAIAKQLSSLTAHSEAGLLELIRAPKKAGEEQYTLSFAQLNASHKEASNANPTALSRSIADKFVPDTFISSVTAKGPTVSFRVNRPEFHKQVLQQVYNENKRYGWAHIPVTENPPTAVIDYSSPNIAKPFHAGHLRSTIIGNFAKRIHQVMGYRVIGVNYLGDWGKQYGLLAIGYERYGDLEDLSKDPIHHLYNIYVRINQEAKENPVIDQEANAYFKRMEQGDSDALSLWNRLREMSIASYKDIYERLGIMFEVYSGESQVESYIPEIYKLLKEKGLGEKADDGALVCNLEPYGLGKPVLRRADGTSLYLTRDLACLLMRKRQYGFDKALYVVGSEQQAYFKQVFQLASLLLDIQKDSLQHVSFGRIQGMSTRRGTAVFLQDILDTAKAQILGYMRDDKQMEESSNAGIADTLGISAILVQDMKSKRNKDYSFSWDRMTDARGDTGVFLQYAHARACGIERKAQVAVVPTCDFSLLTETEAIQVTQLISQFPEFVDLSFAHMEPSTIVNYLFKLSHATSKASHALRVKGQEPELAAARMLLFWAARMTLYNGLTLLGIRPLEHM
ncbi:arginyl-tRNA synthetase [Dichotomocladium elegans]|nr:arginyl-tRNA synthetase [Dichotomocladium elegans]